MKHRVNCKFPGCGRFWRENCAECATDAAARHRAETGHAVELRITPDDDPPMWELREMTRRAHRALYAPGRGW